MMASDGDTVTGPDGEDEQTAEDIVSTAGESGAGLSDEAREWVRRTVAGLGPLTDEERDYLAFMFHRRG